MKTTSLKHKEISKEWILIDADGASWKTCILCFHST